jgi:hypothetical protein
MKSQIDLIDPPSDFSPTSQWREFLASLGNSPLEQSLRQQGEEELARRARAGNPWWVQEPNTPQKDNLSPPTEESQPQKEQSRSMPSQTNSDEKSAEEGQEPMRETS